MGENTGGSNGGSCGPDGDDGHACPRCDKQVAYVIVITPCCVTTAKGGTIFVVKKWRRVHIRP